MLREKAYQEIKSSGSERHDSAGEVLANKLHHLSLISGAHVVEEDNWFSRGILWLPLLPSPLKKCKESYQKFRV